MSTNDLNNLLCQDVSTWEVVLVRCPACTRTVLAGHEADHVGAHFLYDA